MHELVRRGRSLDEAVVTEEIADFRVEPVDLRAGGTQGGGARVRQFQYDRTMFPGMGTLGHEPGGGEPTDQRRHRRLAQAEGASEFLLGQARPVPHREQGTERGGGDPGGGRAATARGQAQGVCGPLQEEEQTLVGLRWHGPILTGRAVRRDDQSTTEVRLR